MTMKINNNVNLTPSLKMNVGGTTDVRQTVDTSFAAKLGQGLSTTAGVLGGATQMGASVLPGGAVLSAALAGAGQQASGAGVGSSSSALTAAGAGTSNPIAAIQNSVGAGNFNSPAPNVPGASSGLNGQLSEAHKMFEMQQGFNLQFMELQNKMGHESRQFQTISNVMKNRNDTAKNSIRNISG